MLRRLESSLANRHLIRTHVRMLAEAGADEVYLGFTGGIEGWVRVTAAFAGKAAKEARFLDAIADHVRNLSAGGRVSGGDTTE